ncbi:5956_t:CDS:2, partial [Scutellospora calospora]
TQGQVSKASHKRSVITNTNVYFEYLKPLTFLNLLYVDMIVLNLLTQHRLVPSNTFGKSTGNDTFKALYGPPTTLNEI